MADIAAEKPVFINHTSKPLKMVDMLAEKPISMNHSLKSLKLVELQTNKNKIIGSVLMKTS